MEKDGASREEIWRKTGWWRGKDGQWRVEIPDISLNDADTIVKAIGGANENITRLGELVDAPELFKAYPDLANVRMVFTEHEDESGALAGYSPETNTIEVYGKGLVGVYDMDLHTRDRYDTEVRKVRDDEFLNKWLSNAEAFGVKHGTFDEEREYAKYKIKRIDSESRTRTTGGFVHWRTIAGWSIPSRRTLYTKYSMQFRTERDSRGDRHLR